MFSVLFFGGVGLVVEFGGHPRFSSANMGKLLNWGIIIVVQCINQFHYLVKAKGFMSCMDSLVLI